MQAFEAVTEYDTIFTNKIGTINNSGDHSMSGQAPPSDIC